MNLVEKLVSMGAYSCAGDLILNGIVVARLRNGVADLTAEGRKIANSDAEDAVIKSERPRRQRTVKQDQPVEPTDVFLGDAFD